VLLAALVVVLLVALLEVVLEIHQLQVRAKEITAETQPALQTMAAVAAVLAQSEIPTPLQLLEMVAQEQHLALQVHLLPEPEAVVAAVLMTLALVVLEVAEQVR
jgi:hypothetical protein